jgi:ATP-dependent Zn proteases
MALVVLGVLIWNFSTKFQHAEKTITFSEFMQAADSGQVARVVITGQDLSGTKKDNDHFQTYVPAQFDGLVNKLIEKGVQVTAKEPTVSPWATILYSWGPFLLIIGFWVFFMRQMQSGGNKALSFGKSKAKLLELAEEGDVQGRRRRDEAKESSRKSSSS